MEINPIAPQKGLENVSLKKKEAQKITIFRIQEREETSEEA